MKSKVFKTNVAAGDVSFNVVPLVDCIFLMILFFILTSTMSDPNVTGTVFLAKPTESKANDAEKETLKNKIVVSVISSEPVTNKGAAETDPRTAGQAKEIAVGTKTFALQDVAGLTAAFKKKRQDMLNEGRKPEDCFIVIRCDWRVQYADVIPVFTAAAEAGIPKMNITVLK